MHLLAFLPVTAASFVACCTRLVCRLGSGACAELLPQCWQQNYLFLWKGCVWLVKVKCPFPPLEDYSPVNQGVNFAFECEGCLVLLLVAGDRHEPVTRGST